MENLTVYLATAMKSYFECITKHFAEQQNALRLKLLKHPDIKNVFQ